MLVELVPPTRASLLIHIQALPAGATLPVRMCIQTPHTWEPPHLDIILKLDEILVCKRVRPPGGKLRLLMNSPGHSRGPPGG